MGMSLPVNPSTSSATVGKDYLVYVNTGTVETPVWTMIGGQKGASLTRKADSIDVSHKTSGGWKSKKAGLREWSIELDGLVLLQNLGLQALEQAFMDGVEVNVKINYPDGTHQQGWGSLTDFSIEMPDDGGVKLKGSIEGNGPLSSRLANAITPLTATMSKKAAADKVFTITPNTATITAINLTDGTTLENESYTYAKGKLTFKSKYLSALNADDYTFTVTLDSGNDLSVTITITE